MTTHLRRGAAIWFWAATHLVALGLARPSVVCSQSQAPDSVTARARTRSGLQHAQADQPQAALEDFLVAYSAKPIPQLLQHIAECYEALGQYPEAALYYRKYLDEAPQPANRLEITQRIAQLDATTSTGTPPTGQPAPWLARATWATAALAITATGAGIASSLLVAHRSKKLSDTKRFQAEAYDDTQRFEAMQPWLYGIGAVAAVTSGVLLYLGLDDNAPVGFSTTDGGQSAQVWTRARF